MGQSFERVLVPQTAKMDKNKKKQTLLAFSRKGPSLVIYSNPVELYQKFVNAFAVQYLLDNPGTGKPVRRVRRRRLGTYSMYNRF